MRSLLIYPFAGLLQSNDEGQALAKAVDTIPYEAKAPQTIETAFCHFDILKFIQR